MIRRFALFAVLAMAAFALGVTVAPGVRGLPSLARKEWQARTAGVPRAAADLPPEQPLPTKPAPASPAWQVSFSPHGGCTEAVVSALAGAKESILVQAYSFTSAPIAEALVAAHRRGVAVQVILDKSNRSALYSSADFVAHAGIPTFIDAQHAIAHNKVMVIDGSTVVTGSFNFTKAAETSNAENLLVIEDPQLAKVYAANWRAHAAHSEAYLGQ